MAEAEIETGGVKQTLKDLFAGAAGGVAQVLLGGFFIFFFFYYYYYYELRFVCFFA